MSKRDTFTAARKRGRKQRKTFTLSADSIALLEQLRVARNGPSRPSTSAVLDDILRGLLKERKRLDVERAVADYYTRASEDERRDEIEWGDFALAQFQKEER